MADKLMYIPNNDTQKYTFLRLQTVIELVWTLNLINQPIKFNKSHQQTRNVFYKPLGTRVTNQPIVPSLHEFLS